MARILIIDDDGQLRSMLRQLLELSQHEVSEAANGVEGVELYRKSPADLIITDLLMPEKDGIATIQDILLEFPQAKIIAMSGGARGNPAWLPVAKRLGALKVLRKPFSNHQLMETVKEILT